MSTIRTLTSRPKRTLTALATALIATGLAVGSGADFTAQSANPSNTFTSGTLTMSNSKDAAAVLTASNMRPGDTANGEVDITNTGSLSGDFTVSMDTLSDSDATYPMSGKLNLVVTDCGTLPATCGDLDDSNVYTGTLGAMGTESLGSFAAGAGHKYKFDIEFDSSADNNYQGDNSSARFVWDATS